MEGRRGKGVGCSEGGRSVGVRVREGKVGCVMRKRWVGMRKRA